MDFPLARMLTTSAPKSWTAPMNRVPSTTHNIAGHPAPDHRDRWSEHGREACDRRIVVAEQDIFARRHIVVSVLELVGRRNSVGVEPEHAFGDPTGVKTVTE